MHNVNCTIRTRGCNFGKEFVSVPMQKGEPDDPPPNPGTGAPSGQVPLALLAGAVLLVPLAALPRGKKNP